MLLVSGAEYKIIQKFKPKSESFGHDETFVGLYFCHVALDISENSVNQNTEEIS